jgi:hypothetical protein
MKSKSSQMCSLSRYDTQTHTHTRIHAKFDCQHAFVHIALEIRLWQCLARIVRRIDREYCTAYVYKCDENNNELLLYVNMFEQHMTKKRYRTD